MEYFIKGLGDIKEGYGAVGFVNKGFTDFVDDTMCLFGGGVSLPEAELMGHMSGIRHMSIAVQRLVDFIPW
jgi:hypothetical protein